MTSAPHRLTAGTAAQSLWPEPWLPYTAPAPHGIAGLLLVDASAAYPALHTTRPLYVWLPPAYRDEPERRFPVLYMHDAQNLFDPAQAHGGSDWQVDETLTALAHEGLQAICVGITHGGARRVREMTPFANGLGEAYLDCIVRTFKPRIDTTFRTQPARDATFILGSSMGGLISLYAFFQHPDTFGGAGVLSPALWPAHGEIFNLVRRAPFRPGRLYIDHGTREPSAHAMVELLRTKGYDDSTLRYVRERGGEHTESAWARRLPHALRFLLGT